MKVVKEDKFKEIKAKMFIQLQGGKNRQDENSKC